LAWFHDVWTCRAKVLQYWMISSLKIKLNPSWKFRRNWNVALALLKRSRLARFNAIYLVRFGFRMWEILIFKWFLQLKIQINSQVLEGKISWGRGNTWANCTGHTSLSMKQGSLFCFVLMRCTKPRCFRSCSWSLWKALQE
jgi:hypothetical protein